MASSFWVRVSAVSILLLPAFVMAQAFGRFGYVDAPPIPGLIVDGAGFAAKFGAADRFSFPNAGPWQVTEIRDIEEDAQIDPATQIRINLLAPGFMIQMKKGFSLKLRSTSAPFLSWKEASVGEGVPTPPVRWIAVSFKEAQPPIVLGFLDTSVSLQVEGTVGDWTIRTLKPYAGWVRVALPMGTRPFATHDAAALGRLSAVTATNAELWTQPAPNLKSLEIQDEPTAVEATWTFDRKGAIIPVGAALANLGYYGLTIKSPNHRLEGYTEEGPTTICDDAKLTIRFPIRRIPLGRSLTLGAPSIQPIGTVSALDVPGVVELAFENLLASRDLRSRFTAEETVKNAIEQAEGSLEPHTRQRLPFDADGRGADSIAANALLYQSFTMSIQASSDRNSLLTAIGLRRDWYTWRTWISDQSIRRRCDALAALAGALCPEPERRLAAAMAQAGLAAERGLGIYLSRTERRPEPTFSEPVWLVRNSIFDMTYAPRRPSGFAESLLSEVRIFGDASVSCSTDLKLVWNDPAGITLASSFPIMATGDQLTVQSRLGYTFLKSGTLGEHSATLELPPWARPLPAFVAPPLYDEPVN